MSQPVVTTYNYHDQYGFFAYGEALVTFGLVEISAINGFGLVTRGLIWQGYDIWGPYAGASLSTSWSAQAGASTLSTTWTPATFNELPES